MRLLRAVLFAAAAVGLATAARADVKPHPLFTDNMVLQQGANIVVWGKADPKENVTVELSRQTANEGSATGSGVAADADGNWKVVLPKQSAGTGYTLTIKGKNTVTLKNVAVGEVWVCSGQSNMEWPVDRCGEPEKVKAGSKNPNLRLFTVKKRTATAPITDQNDLGHFTKWDESGPETVGGFSATAYHFGANLQKSLNVPVGLIHTSWGGTPAQAWTSLEALDAVPELKYYADAGRNAARGKQPVAPGTPGSLYNAMIHPLLPLTIKGAIWYQGESNAGRAFEYRTLFPAMIEDWRKKWGSDFPFYCVQLAPFIDGDPDGVRYAELREAQFLTTRNLPNVGMAVITDAGDLFDIHPKDKGTVGARLALAARAGTYGQKVAGSGPVFKEMKVDGEKAILSFDSLGGGLVGRYGPAQFNATGAIAGFEACGDDKAFYPARAKIEGNTVVVTCEKVGKPVAVRFGWKNYPVVNLYNKDGLPATPFRTDDFPLTTAPKK
jgi:sialate O-acetylesterase